MLDRLADMSGIIPAAIALFAFGIHNPNAEAACLCAVFQVCQNARSIEQLDLRS
jgi:hypothetical protein